MAKKLITKIPNGKEGEATSEIAGNVKITTDYQSILDGNFDSCGSAFTLSAESIVLFVQQIEKSILDKFDLCKKNIEDFVGITYSPKIGESNFPLERKIELTFQNGVGIAINHNLAILKPNLSLYNKNTLNLLDPEVSFNVFYNTPSTLTIIPLIDEEVILYVTAN